MCREFAETVSKLWRTIGQAFDGYRPELYYMRGPGPKWRAKQSGMVNWTRRELAASGPNGRK